MTKVSEYRHISADAPRSTEVLIREAASNIALNRTIRLVEITEGWAVAGSMARWQEARFGVRFTENGTLHGRQFLTLKEAKNIFKVWTSGRT